MKPENVCPVCVACAVLHNIALTKNEPLDDVCDVHDHQDQPVQVLPFKGEQDASDKGSYYNQEEYASESDTTNSDSSLHFKEKNNLNSSVSFLKLTSPFEQSFEVEDNAAAAAAAATNDDDDDDDDESDKEMNISWEVNSNIENISDSDISSDDQEDASVTGRAFIQLEILQKKINQAAVCSTCKTGELNVIDTSENNKSGLCLKLALTCNECNSNTVFNTDGKGNFEYSKIHNVNRLSVLAMRMMGKSRNALLKFCSILDLPSPVNYGPYKKHTETWKEIATEIIEENMSEAAEEIQQLKRKSDGSWAHVGYSSRFGFVSVISVDTGKVLDYVTLSNECKLCKKWEREGKTHIRDFLQWFVEHETDCTLNHDGSAKTMEAQGAVILFRRSVEKHSLQYTTYVGDGDSSAYGNVVDSRPYGPNIIIAKEDCVGHIQGRMGKHLRRLVDQYKADSLLEDEIKKVEELVSLYTKQNNTFHEKFNRVELELESLKADLNVPLGKSIQVQTMNTNAKWNAQDKVIRENRAQPSTSSVGFSATMTEHNQNMNLQDTVKFQNLVTNDGNGFDHISGIFRAPVRGLYFFSVVILSHAGEDMETEIVKNGDGFSELILEIQPPGTQDDSRQFCSLIQEIKYGYGY
ncbi:unnamed protein product [Mytilus coruscus]|uniref:C1q domain-containing protein n=1 Tax=Mytilus coruscus TaxID=42192 RepID=A0A6J8BMW9_MYTCO|nr:unnamed protein product [Mytilus coruscus]